jgi:hypothetical protein
MENLTMVGRWSVQRTPSEKTKRGLPGVSVTLPY